MDLLPNLDDGLVNKKDAWLVWAYQNHDFNQFADFMVYDTSKRDVGVTDYLLQKSCKAKGYIIGDIGNCLADWDKWTLQDVLFKFAFQDQMPYPVRMKAFSQLLRIKEWEGTLKMYSNYLDSYVPLTP